MGSIKVSIQNILKFHNAYDIVDKHLTKPQILQASATVNNELNIIRIW